MKTKIEQWENECLKKKRYDSYSLAEKVAERRTEECGTQLYTYRCESCGEWHLTRQTQSYKRFKFLKVV